MMGIFKSLGRNLKNVFVGSHRGDDFILENLENKKKIVDDDWFDDHYLPELGDKPHPHDSMPIANGSSEYSSRHQSTPDYEKTAEEIVTMHEKMYRMATAKYNPFAIGGSESIHDFEGGSENVQK